MQSDALKFLCCGDSALSVEFGNEINENINARIRAFLGALEKKPIKGVTECVPTYRALLITYDCSKIGFDRLVKKLKSYAQGLNVSQSREKRIIHIPVCYESRFAPDMQNVCEHSSLSPDEVVKIHSSTDYLIYMLGFLPGFPYLGGLDERIHTPRLASPRTRIEAGSVGIGGSQTGVYPLASPGGWQLIGKTPVKLYDPERKDPIFYSAGDYIRFVPVSFADYEKISRLSEDGRYDFVISKE